MTKLMMKQFKMSALAAVLVFGASNASAYKVWLGTHKWEGEAADNLDQWDMAIEKVDGINYVLLDARPDRPAGDGATSTDWKTMIAPIDQSIPGMAEIARSQYAPASSRSLASRMENEFATARNNGGYEIDIIMLYDERHSDGIVYQFDLQDVQDVRDWLDNNGHTEVSIVFRLTNYDQNRLALAQQSIVDGVLIEASATRWLTNPNNQHALLDDLWTDPSTSYKNIYFQLPRSESEYNQYEETRRALKKIRELMGDEFMRSDQAIFLVCNYGNTYPTYPETANNDTLYVNSKSGLALSLIEQRAIFEGRAGVLDQAFCLSYNRETTVVDPAPTSGLVAHWPLDEGTGAAATDATGNGFDGVLLNGATWGGDATRDSYVVFDGTDDHIATTFTYALANTNDFTWAWWAKSALASTDATQKGSIMVGNRYGNTGSETYEFIKFTPVSTQFANTSDTSEIERYDYADIPQNEWRHYSMVKEGASYQWYVDGVAQGVASNFNYSETSPLPFFIGGDPGNGGKVGEHFNGFIDDVILYREALTPAEVMDVKNGNYPYAPLEYELIAGWDTWNSGVAPTASVFAANIAAAAVTTSEDPTRPWHVTDERGASADGTWGTFAGPPTASVVTNADFENLELPNAVTGGTITFTITNNGAADVMLGGFHFDAYAFRSKAARTYELSVLAGGGISAGVVFTSAEDAITEVGGSWDNTAHDDIDHDLTGLADHTLAAGETAVFLLAFSGGAGDGSGGHDLWVDNVGVTGAFSPTTEPPEPPVIEHEMSGGDLVFSWTGNGFKVQSRTNLVEGIWQDVPGGDSPPVTHSTTESEAFFRLIEQ